MRDRGPGRALSRRAPGGREPGFAAATAAVNRRVVADARRAGVWVCSASDPDAGDFTVPAVWRDGPLTLTVATAGASPALAAALRDRAAEALGPAAAGLAALLAELRPEVSPAWPRARGAPPPPGRLGRPALARPLARPSGPDAVRRRLCCRPSTTRRSSTAARDTRPANPTTESVTLTGDTDDAAHLAHTHVVSALSRTRRSAGRRHGLSDTASAEARQGSASP